MFASSLGHDDHTAQLVGYLTDNQALYLWPVLLVDDDVLEQVFIHRLSPFFNFALRVLALFFEVTFVLEATPVSRG